MPNVRDTIKSVKEGGVRAVMPRLDSWVRILPGAPGAEAFRMRGEMLGRDMGLTPHHFRPFPLH